MTAPANDALLITLLAAFTACVGYAAGRLHQWYRTGLDRDEAYRDGYDTATRSVFSMAARLIGPRRAVRGTAVVTSAVITTAPPVPGGADAAGAVGGSGGADLGAVGAGGGPAVGGLGAAASVGGPGVGGLSAAGAASGLGVAGPSAVAAGGSGVAEPSAVGAGGGSGVAGPRPVAAAGAGPGAVGAAGRGVMAPAGRGDNGRPTGVPGPSEPAAVLDAPVPVPGPVSRPRRRGRDGGDSTPARSGKQPEGEPSGGGRHLVPDELVQAPTYRLAPDRVARAKVRGAAPAEAGEQETTRLPSVPRPRSS